MNTSKMCTYTCRERYIFTHRNTCTILRNIIQFAFRLFILPMHMPPHLQIVLEVLKVQKLSTSRAQIFDISNKVLKSPMSQ